MTQVMQIPSKKLNWFWISRMSLSFVLLSYLVDERKRSNDLLGIKNIGTQSRDFSHNVIFERFRMMSFKYSFTWMFSMEARTKTEIGFPIENPIWMIGFEHTFCQLCGRHKGKVFQNYHFPSPESEKHSNFICRSDNSTSTNPIEYIMHKQNGEIKPQNIWSYFLNRYYRCP